MMTSDQLKGWRAEKRWTQAQAAEALGYSERGYQELEKRDKGVSRTVELAIAGYEAERGLDGVKPVPSFLSPQDETTCYVAFDAMPSTGLARTLALATWAEKWGRALIAPLHTYGHPRAAREPRYT